MWFSFSQTILAGLNSAATVIRLTEDRDQMVTWIDLNVPYHATWLQENSDKFTRKGAERTKKYKKIYSGIDDDIEWLPKEPIEKPEFIKPAKVERPVAITLKGWPLVGSVTKETKKIKIGSKEITLVKVPAGKFVMGSVTGGEDEYPQTIVEIKKPFWISTTEITNDQMRQFNPKHDSKFIDQQWKDHVFPGYPANKPEMPAVRVSWNDSMEFCKWLSKKTGMKVNLPTEAQWEWAARAGSDQPWPFGSTGFEKYANLADQSLGLLAVSGINPKPVKPDKRTLLNDFLPRDKSFDDKRLLPDGTAQYKPNAWGIYDMIGNVCERKQSVRQSERDISNSFSMNTKSVLKCFN